MASVPTTMVQAQIQRLSPEVIGAAALESLRATPARAQVQPKPVAAKPKTTLKDFVHASSKHRRLAKIRNEFLANVPDTKVGAGINLENYLQAYSFFVDGLKSSQKFENLNIVDSDDRSTWENLKYTTDFINPYSPAHKKLVQVLQSLDMHYEVEKERGWGKGIAVVVNKSDLQKTNLLLFAGTIRNPEKPEHIQLNKEGIAGNIESFNKRIDREFWAEWSDYAKAGQEGSLEFKHTLTAHHGANGAALGVPGIKR